MELEQINIGKQLSILRSQLNLTLEDTAALTGVSKPMLSQIEHGKSIPTITILWKIATGLKTPFSYFLDSPKADYMIGRPDQGCMVSAEEGKMKAFTLFPYDPLRSQETFFIEFEPGCLHHSPNHNPGVEETVLVIDGTLDMILEGKTIEVSKTQALRFRADCSHTYHNKSNKPCRIYNIIHYPG
ncbi:helix-turn-helix transcriptional regulator [Erysipelotrichaceae bacterium RD49]|nr:helix-turn-helix transcriptional regulator [Erysipelotrichaceae bacterium RD49]